MSNVTVITHPLVQHKLTLMRKKDASTNSFRRLLGELSTLMAYEVTRDMPLQDVADRNPAGDHDRQDDRRQEAGAGVHPARRQWLSGRHAQRGARRARGPHRPVPRPQTRCSRSSTTSRCLPKWTSATSSWSTPCWPPATRLPPAVDRLKQLQAPLHQVRVPAGRA